MLRNFLRFPLPRFQKAFVSLVWVWLPVCLAAQAASASTGLEMSLQETYAARESEAPEFQASRTVQTAERLAAADSARPPAVPSDSSQAASEVQADPLLPEILSPGEKLMWGEHGFMRVIGAFPLTEESREKELQLRRTMLTVHQIGGFLTLASMVATDYCGQMIVNGESGYEGAKSTLAWTTVGAYFATASLSLLSPPPVIRRPGWSSVSTHKALAWVHFTGMIITPLLGTMIEDKHDLRLYHQISGYVTTAAFAGAMFVITF
ncbi:MAG: hypothetical protein JWO30_1638 [Fibrobacteres bacterium]|nr:hypothetical protein [Fibrobacterota bacterium]